MFYGTGSKNLGNVHISNEKCPNCNEQNHLFVHGLASYFHIMWIPIFPYNKKLITKCDSCDTEFKFKKLPQHIKDKIELEKATFKTPLFLFSGLVLLVLLFTWISYTAKKHKEFVGNRINHLEQNDILVFKSNSSEYTFAKVMSVINDTVYFKNSNYSINQKPTKSDYDNGITTKNDFFDDELYFYTQQQIDSLNVIDKLDIFEE